MEKSKRTALVFIGIALLGVASYFLITQIGTKTNHEEYVSSLEDKEIITLELMSGDIIILTTDELDDSNVIIKIEDEGGKVVASSQSELGEGIDLIYTAEEDGEYVILATLDNPDAEIDGTINISVQNYSMLYIFLLGGLLLFSTILIISSSLLREHYIIPSELLIQKKKLGAIGAKEPKEPREKEAPKGDWLEKGEAKKRFKALIQPIGKDVMEQFINRIYRGIEHREDVIGSYAIDLKTEQIIWRLSDQKQKSEFQLLENPTLLQDNRGIYSIYEKMIELYGGVLPAEIVLSFPNYYLNGLVHKQVLVLVLLKPDVDWGISSTIFKK